MVLDNTTQKREEKKVFLRKFKWFVYLKQLNAKVGKVIYG